MGTNFRGLNKYDTFVGFKIRGHRIFFHKSYRKSPFRGYWNSWIGPSTKTTRIGTPWNLSHPQYIYIGQARSKCLANLLNEICIKVGIYFLWCWFDSSRTFQNVLPYTQKKLQQPKWQHKNTTKNFDYTRIVNWLRTVSWSDDSHPTGVFRLVCTIPTFPLTVTNCSEIPTFPLTANKLKIKSSTT